MSPGGVIPPGKPVGGKRYAVTCTCGWHRELSTSVDECDWADERPLIEHKVTSIPVRPRQAPGA